MAKLAVRTIALSNGWKSHLPQPVTIGSDTLLVSAGVDSTKINTIQTCTKGEVPGFVPEDIHMGMGRRAFGQPSPNTGIQTGLALPLFEPHDRERKGRMVGFVWNQRKNGRD